MSSTDISWFEVTFENLIIDPDTPEPRIRAEVFERVDLNDGKDCRGLIEVIRGCEPLAQYLRNLSHQYLRENTGSAAFLRNLICEPVVSSGSQKMILRALRNDPDDGWQQWIEWSGDESLGEFRQVVSDWLADEIDWKEAEHFDSLWNGQMAAFGYFEDFPGPTLKALGVRVIDGVLNIVQT